MPKSLATLLLLLLPLSIPRSSPRIQGTNGAFRQMDNDPRARTALYQSLHGIALFRFDAHFVTPQ